MKDCFQLLSQFCIGENKAAQVSAIWTSIPCVGLCSKLILNGAANFGISRQQFMGASVSIESPGRQALQKAFRE